MSEKTHVVCVQGKMKDEWGETCIGWVGGRAEPMAIKWVGGQDVQADKLDTCE